MRNLLSSSRMLGVLLASLPSLAHTQSATHAAMPLATVSNAPRNGKTAPITTAAALPTDSALVRALAFRSIGPAIMGGRIVEIAVAENVRGSRLGTVMYIAAATGGVWKTTNSGSTWTAVFDSVRASSVGAVAVSPSNSDIVWVGTGEANNMRSSSWGVGVFKSNDGGKTWSAPMLPKSQHIGRIVVDPRDPNVVYVAAMGPLWSPGGERGLYKTTDGGKTWTNTKDLGPQTGFTDVVMDATNPEILYAASMQRERRSFGFIPSGPLSALWKTVDGGRNWTKLTQGLPAGDLGRMGISVCRSRPNVVYAVVNAKNPSNGLYRSDDAGNSWTLMNGTYATAWYYGQVRCDPTDHDHVVRLQPASQESFDGGRTWVPFANAPTVHADNHALWINPEAPEHMVYGNDGGLNITYDKGRTWTHSENMVLSQFYTVAADDAQPFYNVYGGLQDNQAWGGPNRTRNSFGPSNADWFRMSGGDGFFAVPDPSDWNIVYAESQEGGVSRYDARTGQSKNIKPVPTIRERYRFNWSAPILPSRHVARTVYMGANYLFKSTDRGDSWEKISPDLTRQLDRSKMVLRGVVQDSNALGLNEGTALFGNIATVDESPLKAGLLAVGTDDGLVHVTRDGGKTWTKTEHFPGVPDTTYVSRVLFSSASEGTLYAALDGHRNNDFMPYLMKSTDYGKTWTSITGNLPPGGTVQAVREHPRQPNLIFVGTDIGVYFTVSGGGEWTQLKTGIPTVPVMDLAIQPRWNDLVVGTHGRGIYILDDLAPLEKLAAAKQASVAYLFPIRSEIELQPNASRSSGMGLNGFTGQNPDVGVRVAYQLNNIASDAKTTLSIVDATGKIVRDIPVSKQNGLYRPLWDMRVGPPLTAPLDTTPVTGRGGNGGVGGAAGGGGGGGGGRGGGAPFTFPALAGTYKARLTIASAGAAPLVLEQTFALKRDAVVPMTDAELKQLYDARLNTVRVQRTLTERQAQADSTRRQFAAIKLVADSNTAKLSAPAKAELAAIDKEIKEIVAAIGGPAAAGGRGGAAGGGGGGGGAAGAGGGGAAGAGGRGAAGAGGRGAAGAGRGGAAGGRGGAATTAVRDTTIGAAGAGSGGSTIAVEESQVSDAGLPPVITLQAQIATLAEMLNNNFNANPSQVRVLRFAPDSLAKQNDRIQKLRSDRLPALIKLLNEQGVTVKQ
ncbi:MAG: glycosyl hydrolase [Gemmatimonadaceae bacterium]